MMRALPVLTMCVVAMLGAACGGKQEAAKPAAPAAAVAPPTELQKIDIQKGTGEGISQGQVAVVHYTG